MGTSETPTNNKLKPQNRVTNTIELLYTEYCQLPDLPQVYLVILQYKLPTKLHIKFSIPFGKEFNDAVV